jgi:hypothetical protein
VINGRLRYIRLPAIRTTISKKHLARIRAQGVQYYADPRRAKPGEINYLHGGRGVYFADPNGHVMEIITHPYGERPEQI